METFPPCQTLPDHFADRPDPRTGPAMRHQLLDIVTIAVCEVICGADTWVAVEQFGRRKQGFPAQFPLALKGNLPPFAAEIANVCADAIEEQAGAYQVESAQTVEKGHGRVERRRCWTIGDPAVIAWFDPGGVWAGPARYRLCRG